MFSQAMADIFTPENTRFIMRGFLLTIQVAVSVVLISVFFGTILALCRNYGGVILKSIASAYIEIFRNTPLLLWMLACLFVLRIRGSNVLTRGSIAFILYTSSVMAEIVRGGMNSIAHGQWEAASSQGFSKLQTMVYIILPQTFLRIIPSMMSQIVTTVKDTSFLSQFAIAEMFYQSKVVLSSLGRFTAVNIYHIFILFGFVASIYFIFNFTLSMIARRIKFKSM